MVDVVTITNTQEPLKQGLCVALPKTKQELLELKKIKEKSLNDKTIVRK